MRERARELGEIIRVGLTKNETFRQELDVCGRGKMLQQISHGSRAQGFALRESSWEALNQATTEELRHLTVLALMPVSESGFCEVRHQVLETPEFWPMLAETEPAD